jgi:hypothetical protein
MTDRMKHVVRAQWMKNSEQGGEGYLEYGGKPEALSLSLSCQDGLLFFGH